MARVMSEQEWADAVAEQVRALEAAAIATDWSGAELCTTSLAALLATPPNTDRAHTEAVFIHAYQAVGPRQRGGARRPRRSAHRTSATGQRAQGGGRLRLIDTRHASSCVTRQSQA